MLLSSVLICSKWLTHNSLQHNLLILLNLLILGAAYPYFKRPFYLSYSFVFIFAFNIFALFYGTFGSYLLRDSFQGINSLADAIYFTVVTYSTVGYGDILPLSPSAKYFVISMIVIGLIMFTTGITLIAYMLNSKLKSLIFNINKGKISMSNHIVFIGYGILTKMLIERYRKNNEKYIVIDQGKNMDTEREVLLEQNLLMIAPYPGHVETLVRARLSEAKIVIISYDSDADTIFAIMNIAQYLKEFSKRPKILARILYEENIEKAKIVGADEVVAPHLLAASEIERLSL